MGHKLRPAENDANADTAKMKRMKYKFIAISLILGILWIPLSACAKCVDQRDVPDTAVYQLKSWDNLYQSYLQYGDCGNDGALGEAYSDAIEKLFTNDWKNIERLSLLSSKDKGFETFVLNQHIDMTWSADSIAALEENAEKNCPSDAVGLCKKLKERIGELKLEVEEEQAQAHNTSDKPTK